MKEIVYKAIKELKTLIKKIQSEIIKRKLISFIAIIIVIFLMGLNCGKTIEVVSNKTVSVSTVKNDSYVVKNTADEIVELAHSIELPEDDVIVVRAKEISDVAYEQFCKDRDIIATVVFNEAGYGCSDRHMELVAAVVYNRLKSDKFPNSIYDIVVAPKQYHPAYADANSYYGKRARESEVWSKCQEIATRALEGKIECPTNVVYQANFRQGTGVYEVHHTSYSTTWFCYGDN